MTDVNEKSPGGGFEIAVIGMAGRFPGAKNIDEFWINLKNGVETICFFSAGELKPSGVEAALADNPSYVKAKGILEDGECFDFPFFDYTAREAENMDPQLRILHECSWTALEHAGYNPGSYEGTIGLYIGSTFNVHWVSRFLNENIGRPSELFDAANLNDKDSFATAISYKLNLRGPAVVVQTACSTSLAAIHLACQALLVGECDMALAGGVCVTSPQKAGYWYQEGMIFSADGHCRSFDAGAGGTVLGNGVGLVVLKPLEEALAQGDFIYARVKASAMNNDGKRKVGFTAPSVKGQAEVIVTAHCAAGVPAESIGYMEAHGTGTALGDPVEIEALKQAFAADKRGFCALGSVKTNIGHLDAAAGVAGFIKTVLVLMHRLIPPILHFKTPNPKIDFQDSPFYIDSEPREWKRDGYPLRAGVSSFGIGGTNVHVILEEAPGGTGGLAPLSIEKAPGAVRGGIPLPSPLRQYRLILLSAGTETSLEKMTINLVNYLKANQRDPVNPGNPGLTLADAAYTLQVGRNAFPYRKMLVARDVQEVIAALSNGGPGKIQPSFMEEASPTVVFMFPGQGSQYIDMGRGLYETEPYFRQEMDRCFEILDSLLDYDIKEILYPAGGEVSSTAREPTATRNPRLLPDINQTEIAQPLLFIFEYALAKMMINWGIEPDAMIGHSIGEYTAACLSGVYSLEDALKLVVLRGRLMQRVPGGAMLGVRLSRDRLKPILDAHEELSLAAVNAPTYCVVSGPAEAVGKLEKQLDEKGCIGRRLHTSHAFHSRMMEPVSDEFERALRQAKITFHSPSIPFISNSGGTWITAKEASSPGYWAAQLRETVQFSRGVEALFSGKGEEDRMVFLEVGPGRTLSALIRKQEDKRPRLQVVNVVRHPQEDIPDDYYLLNRVGQLWLAGMKPDWQGFYAGESRQRIPLPTYSFEGLRPGEDPAKMSRQQRRESREGVKKPDIADWFYLPGWRESHRSTDPEFESFEPMNWLILAKEAGWAHRFREKLQALHHQVILVKTGNEFASVDEEEYIINPREQKHYNALFHHLVRTHRVPRQILHCWNVDTAGPVEFGPVLMEESLELGFYSLLSIARAIGQEMITADIQLHVITTDLHRVTGDERLRPDKAPLLGPVKVIPHEYGNIRCRNIDVDASQWNAWGEEASVKVLLGEVLSGASTNVVAYRENSRWVESFRAVHLERAGGGRSRLKDHGVYLITGGLGGIGLCLAKYLAGAVKAKLVLWSRSALPGRERWGSWLDGRQPGDKVRRRIREIREIESQGSDVMLIGADISNPRQVKSGIQRIKERFGRIHGVFHCAGLPEGALIQGRTREMSMKTLAPKVMGAVLLDDILKEKGLEPDFFVLCSSLGNLLPQQKVGQVAYNAANEFFDAFCHYKNAVGNTFTVSINWEDWQQVGMSAESAKDWDKKLESGPDPQPGREKGTGSIDNFHVDMNTPGNLGSLRFTSASRRKPARGEVEIEVHAAGLNFKDVLYALGMLPPPKDDLKFGQECSGRIVSVGEGLEDFKVGSEVIAAGDSCFSAYVTIPACFVALKPANLSFEEAATIPVAHMTAYYALVKVGRLRKGERVLIHAAAGGVGMAAVGIARGLGAEIFATAGTPEKREYLRGLGVKYVMNSRTLDFVHEVMKYTRGKGVHVVLNSLSGEFLTGSITLLAPFGRFLEIGVRDVSNNMKLGLQPFEKGLSFTTVYVTPEAPGYTATWREMAALAAKGDLEPLPFKLFSTREIPQAFEYMAMTRHIGKIIISLKDKDEILRMTAASGNREKIAESAARRNKAPGVFQAKLRDEGILPSEGLEVVNRILGSHHSRVVVSPGDLKVLMGKKSPPVSLLAGRQRPGVPRPAGTGIRTLLMASWNEFLGSEPGSEDNFFDLGATSFDVIQVANRLQDVLRRHVPLAAFYKYQTVGELANYLEGDKEAGERDRAGELKKGRETARNRFKLRKGIKDS